MNIVQVDLEESLPGIKTKRQMTTWVNDRPDLKPGVIIELKSVDGFWTVKKVYNDLHTSDEFDWHRKWDNNI